jgi:hypothetical protein
MLLSLTDLTLGAWTTKTTFCRLDKSPARGLADLDPKVKFKKITIFPPNRYNYFPLKGGQMSVGAGKIKLSTKVGNQMNRKKQKMENTLTVGSQFTTAKSGVSGTIQEVVANKNGTFRVRLDVNGQPRWTTVK